VELETTSFELAPCKINLQIPLFVSAAASSPQLALRSLRASVQILFGSGYVGLGPLVSIPSR
jgi:hypothetical protein